MLYVTAPNWITKKPAIKIGLVLVTILVLCAIFGPILTGTDPTAMSIRSRFKPPSMRFPFGSDQYGRDILTRVLYGGRLSLSIGLSVALVSGMTATAEIVTQRKTILELLLTPLLEPFQD